MRDGIYEGKSDHDLLVIAVTKMGVMEKQLEDLLRQDREKQRRLDVLETQHKERVKSGVECGIVGMTKRQLFGFGGATGSIGGLLVLMGEVLMQMLTKAH